MFGCLGRIGCGLLLILLGAVGYATRDKWVPKVRELIAARMPAATDEWAAVTAEGAERAATRIRGLESRGAESSVALPAAEFAAYVLAPALPVIAAADGAPEAVIAGDTLFLRARIRLADVGGAGALGPLARMFDEHEPILLGGHVETVRAGLAQFRVSSAALRDLRLPAAGVARLLARWDPSTRPEGVAADALPILLPEWVREVRLERGRVRLVRGTGSRDGAADGVADGAATSGAREGRPG
jgi:hypothetical protein